MNLKTEVINGVELKYRKSDENVLIPTEYHEKESYFRSVWVSLICQDFEASLDKATMQKNLLEVLDYLERMHMNAIIFHVRTYNNAYYKTMMAPIDEHFGTYETFQEWDYLTWFIDECHNRGIEFHAWLNPYRIKSSGYPEGYTEEDVSKEYVNYPLNPASYKENILMTYDGGAILNPAIKEVQDYIIDVCLELMRNYNIDAIHFDDYFYAQMSKDLDFLHEPDQKQYLEFIKNNETNYKASDREDKMQWRRDNVDNFIHGLSDAIRKFNKENNRQVQLGISPTGIYQNGDGKVTYDEEGNAITTGSNTCGQEHKSSYLFCDTKKWVDNEWIDYIVPQSYWGFVHPAAGYADVMDWWNKVIQNKRVNLYSGMGIYMANRPTTYSWYDYDYEASDQILYCGKLENVKGTVIFNFKHLKEDLADKNIKPYYGLNKIKDEYWTKPIDTPKTIASLKEDK